MASLSHQKEGEEARTKRGQQLSFWLMILPSKRRNGESKIEIRVGKKVRIPEATTRDDLLYNLIDCWKISTDL